VRPGRLPDLDLVVLSACSTLTLARARLLPPPLSRTALQGDWHGAGVAHAGRQASLCVGKVAGAAHTAAAQGAGARVAGLCHAQAGLLICGQQQGLKESKAPARWSFSSNCSFTLASWLSGSPRSRRASRCTRFAGRPMRAAPAGMDGPWSSLPAPHDSQPKVSPMSCTRRSGGCPSCCTGHCAQQVASVAESEPPPERSLFLDAHGVTGESVVAFARATAALASPSWQACTLLLTAGAPATSPLTRPPEMRTRAASLVATARCDIFVRVWLQPSLARAPGVVLVATCCLKPRSLRPVLPAAWRRPPCSS
jgi:hypothetical protein